MKLFQTGKVGMFLDDFGPSTEKRKNGEAEVIVLTLRVQPFTAQLASSMDQKIRAALFMLGGNAEPKKEIEAAAFHLAWERQTMSVFTTSDTVQASIFFDHVKVQSVRARIERGVDGYACVIKLAFGPASKDELEYINGWYKGQRSCSFEMAEPNLDYDEPQPEKKVTAAPLLEVSEPSTPKSDVEPARRIPKRKDTNGSGAHA